ncbi:MAG: outer membrane homotrimeric porin [Mailhella sp.]|nr:outer membrane homotrimeric porin [Mailhella sp.]
MKKLLTLGLAAGLVMAASAPASAIDVKMDGLYTFQYDWEKNFTKDGPSMDYQWQYVRVGATFTASEALSGYFQVEGRWQWGNGTDPLATKSTDLTGGNQPGDYPNAAVRMAYIDWLVPGTPVKVRMGRQALAPVAVATGKNPAFWQSDPADGIAISAPINDMFAVNAFWARYGRNTSWVTCDADTADLFYLGGSMKLDGFQLQPWVAFAAVDEGSLIGINGFRGNDSQMAGHGDSNIYWAGATATLNLFDPFVAKASFVYGDRNFKGADAAQHGWFADAVVSYKTPYGTPSLAGWYASGDNDGDYQYQGNLPGIAGRNALSMGFFNGGPFMDNIRQHAHGNHHSASGTWGVRLAMDNISFLQDLSHSVAVVFTQGTNDKQNTGYDDPWLYMTSKDRFVEFDFTTTYKIYKNLSAIFGVAYIVEDFKTGAEYTRADSYDNGWGISAQISYAF